MAKRVRVKPEVSRALRTEAGEKCANPGCTRWRTHLHHIEEWAVYQTNDPDHMVAICPSCHDEVHHGRLEISDADLYRWKGIKRPCRPDYFRMFVEPAKTQTLLLGSICAQLKYSTLLLTLLTDRNSLSFRVVDDRFLEVSMRLHTVSGMEVLHVPDNIVQVPHSDQVSFEGRDGNVRVTVPATDYFIPLRS
jgi:hypothetical protein